MSPRTGRPTDDPKTKRMEIRISLLDSIKLEYCCETLNLSKSEVIREGINNVYQKALESSKKQNIARLPINAMFYKCLEVSFCKYYNADGDFFQEHFFKIERSFYYAGN